MELSLRDTEHCFRLLYFVFSQTHEQEGSNWLITLLIILKIKNPDLYSRFIKNQSSCKEVVEYINRFISVNQNKIKGDAKFIRRMIENQLYSAAPYPERNNIRGELRQIGVKQHSSPLKNEELLYTANRDETDHYIELNLKPYPVDFLQTIAALLDLAKSN